MNAHRITIRPVRPIANRGIVPQYAIESAAWIAHPSADTQRDQFYDFALAFRLETACTFRVHVSADQRFELFCDGCYVGMGPDRSDPRQLSTSFSMIWIMMIRDLAWWQRDAAFIQGLLPGLRAQLEQFRALADDRMLVKGLPDAPPGRLHRV